MIIDLEDPHLQVGVDEEIETQDLETVALPLVPPAVKLILLLLEAERLHGQDTFLADFRYLLEQVSSVNALLILQLLENVRKRPFA